MLPSLAHGLPLPPWPLFSSVNPLGIGRATKPRHLDKTLFKLLQRLISVILCYLILFFPVADRKAIISAGRIFTRRRSRTGELYLLPFVFSPGFFFLLMVKYNWGWSVQSANSRVHWSEQAEKWLCASVMCVLEIKHRTIGNIARFVKILEESGTADGTETILPSSDDCFFSFPAFFFLLGLLYLCLSRPHTTLATQLQQGRWNESLDCPHGFLIGHVTYLAK